jgi:hypothetical protein
MEHPQLAAKMLGERRGLLSMELTWEPRSVEMLRILLLMADAERTRFTSAAATAPKAASRGP